MSDGRIYKAIKSDPGLLITIVFAVGGITFQYSAVMNKIDNVADSVSQLSADFRGSQKDQQAKDTVQDTNIVQNSVNIANIQGSLSQHNIAVRQFDVRPMESSTTNQ